MKAIYAALLAPIEDGGYVVRVPDIPGCVTTGKTLEEALSNIQDALSGCLCVLEDRGEPIHKPSAPEDIQDGESMIMLIQVDTVRYRKETDTRAVRKNVSLPAWLAYMADQKGLNCSQILQRELKRQLRID